jgi:hypothetical protein
MNGNMFYKPSCFPPSIAGNIFLSVGNFYVCQSNMAVSLGSNVSDKLIRKIDKYDKVYTIINFSTKCM